MPRDPMILPLEKEDKKPLKRCCSACSIGKCCIKYRQTNKEEDVNLLVYKGRPNKKEEKGREQMWKWKRKLTVVVKVLALYQAMKVLAHSRADKGGTRGLHKPLTARSGSRGTSNS